VKAILEKVRSEPYYLLWLAFLGVVLALGGYASGVRYLGHEEVMGATNLVPLGILISTYVFFVVTSTGLCFVTSFGHVFGFHRFEIIAKRGVFLSIITLLAGFLAIGVETERPWRLGSLFLTSPNFTAPIWWMAFFYTLYLIFLVIELCGLFLRRTVLARSAGLLGFLTAIAAHSTLGAIFGLIKAKAFWEGPYLPIYFILSALVSGTAFLIIMTVATYWVERRSIPSQTRDLLIHMGKRLLVLFLGIVIFFWTWKVITSLYGHPPEKYEAMMSLLAGPQSVNFWLFEVAIGILIPFFFLLLHPAAKSVRGVFIGSLLVFAGLFVSRFDLVVGGQIAPVWGGPYASYSPSCTEWVVVAASVALCLLIYSLGERLLPLEEGDSRSSAGQTVEADTGRAS
jgi:molybdopterin-containing oxidoreductase family membrane subunit